MDSKARPRSRLRVAGPALRAVERPPRVLLVEDDEDNRIALVELLVECGYQVEARATAVEGLAALGADADYDAVLTDYQLPGESGAWLLEQAVASKLLDPARAIAITAHPRPRGLEKFTVLKKPIDLDALFEALERLKRKA